MTCQSWPSRLSTMPSSGRSSLPSVIAPSWSRGQGPSQRPQRPSLTGCGPRPATVVTIRTSSGPQAVLSVTSAQRPPSQVWRCPGLAMLTMWMTSGDPPAGFLMTWFDRYRSTRLASAAPPAARHALPGGAAPLRALCPCRSPIPIGWSSESSNRWRQPSCPAGCAVTGWASLRMHGASFFDGRDPRDLTLLPVPVVCPVGQLRQAPGVEVLRDRLPWMQRSRWSTACLAQPSNALLSTPSDSARTSVPPPRPSTWSLLPS